MEMETCKYINKTVCYLKESSDGFYYLGSIDVYAVSDKLLFDKTFTKCVAVDSIFEHYEDAKAYMETLGVEFYVDENKVGFKKIYKAGTDLVAGKN